VKSIQLQKIVKMAGLSTMFCGIMEKQLLLDYLGLFLEKESLHLLMFENIMSRSVSPGAFTTFYKQIHSNNIGIVKDIIHNHKNLLSLPDNKVKLDNIRVILLHHNISILPNMKVADSKDLLLRHCNTTMTMPLTFVSDGSIENYMS